MATDICEFYRGLDEAKRERMLRAAQTSNEYMRLHVLPGRKLPRPQKMAAIAKAARAVGWDGTEEDLVAQLYAAKRKREAMAS